MVWKVIEQFGTRKNKYDHLVFFRNSNVGIILLVVYLDGIVITGSDMIAISSLKSFLHHQFHIKDLRLLKYLLEVNIMKSKHGIF